MIMEAQDTEHLRELTKACHGRCSILSEYNPLCLDIRKNLKELKNELETLALFLYLEQIKITDMNSFGQIPR